jgi:hypothetical protein
VLKFFPTSAYFARTGCSDKALYFTDEDLRHRFLILYEAIGLGPEPRGGMETNHFAYAVRTLLSENRLRYEIAVKTEEGIKSQVLDKEGPTGLITTATAREERLEVASEPNRDRRDPVCQRRRKRHRHVALERRQPLLECMPRSIVRGISGAAGKGLHYGLGLIGGIDHPKG